MNYGPIVGCWQMVEAWDLNDPGKPGKSYPWGQPPLGYWVYDPAGNFSVQISINPPLPGTDQQRPFRLVGDDELIIGDPTSYERRFQRVASFGTK
jgi:hypothetical protein